MQMVMQKPYAQILPLKNNVVTGFFSYLKKRSQFSIKLSCGFIVVNVIVSFYGNDFVHTIITKLFLTFFEIV